jgi:glucose 1-dehydrogenase
MNNGKIIGSVTGMEKLGEDKKALVTGGSRGIGRGIALVMASEGYDLAITYSTKKEEAEETARVINREYGRKCVVFQASMENEDTPCKLVEQAIGELDHLDVLVNNAGVTMTESITELTIEKMNFLINLNFKAYLLAAQAAAKHMIHRQIKGNIINITSTRGSRAYPGDAVYGGLKAAIIRATESIALDLAPYHIRVNCIAPGATQVLNSKEADRHSEIFGQRIPLGRVGLPYDVGNTVVWLASDKASYITGINIRVDGGLILPGMPECAVKENDGWGAVKK